MQRKLGPVFSVFIVAPLFAGGCSSEPEVAERSQEVSGSSLEQAVRDAAFSQGLEGSPKLDQPDLTAAEQALVDKRSEIGRFVFHDQALGGPLDSSCATCHHPAFHGADGQNVARGVFCTKNGDGTVSCDDTPLDGVGGNVVGPHRTAPLNMRNSPTVINSPLFPKQMLDGRFHFVDDSSTDVNELDPSQGFQIQGPEGVVFTRSVLAAQAFKPVPSVIEMAADFPFEGQVLPPAEIRTDAVRHGIATRLDGIEAYRDLFEAAYPPGQKVFPTDPEIGEDDPITYFAIADAMATWEEQALVMTDSPWDAFLAGDDGAISESAKRGALVFFTRGECSSCHSGDLFTDFENYNLGVPQIGPGNGATDPDPAYQGYTNYDFGAEHTTGDRDDRFKFRTPPLRGVTLTSPYMHNGAYTDLADAIRHHEIPRASYANYDKSQLFGSIADFPKAPIEPVFDASNPVVVGPETDIHIELSEQDIDDLVAFLRTLTDPEMLEFVDAAPAELPSGVPADVPGPREFPLFQ